MQHLAPLGPSARRFKADQSLRAFLTSWTGRRGRAFWRDVAAAGIPAPARIRVTFAQLASDWLVQVVPMYKHSTQTNHRHLLAKHLLPRFGETALTDVGRPPN